MTRSNSILTRPLVRSAASSQPPTTVQRVWSYVSPYRGTLLLALLCMVGAGASLPCLLWLANKVLQPMLEVGGSFQELSGLVGLAFLVLLLKGVCEFGELYLSNAVGQQVVVRLRDDFYRHLQRLSLGYFEDRQTGQVMSHATNDINTFQEILTLGLIDLVRSPVAILGTVGYMLRLDWRLTLLMLIGGPFIAWAISRASARMGQITQDVQNRLSDISARLQETISAMRIVQCFATGDREQQRFAEENEASRQAIMRSVRLRALLEPGIELIGGIGLLLIMWVGGWWILRGGSLSAKNLIILIGGAQAIINHARKLARLRLTLKRGFTAVERIFGVLDTPPDILERPDAQVLNGGTGHVQFEHVSFAYKSGREVLHDLTFEIRPGEAVALVGPSGAGKSTVANLIPRLYDVSRGRVRVDGHDVRDLTLHSLRQAIGIVPQETILFRGTIRDNIAYGRPDATDAEIEAAARAANAHEFIQAFPEGYETMVGERGKKLSGGQCQRIAMARALLRDPRILILDEATSSLDTEAEAEVQKALETLMANRTTLIIAHRLSTIQNADRILVLDEGRIVEEGSHTELLSRHGLYSKLYEIQAAGAKTLAVDERGPLAG